MEIFRLKDIGRQGCEKKTVPNNILQSVEEWKLERSLGIMAEKANKWKKFSKGRWMEEEMKKGEEKTVLSI